MGRLIVLVGIPGAGKTTFAKSFEGKIVSTDAVRKRLYGHESTVFSRSIADFLTEQNDISLDGLTPGQIKALQTELCIAYIFQVARKECCDLLAQGETVIYDSTNCLEKYRRQILAEAGGLYEQSEVYFLNVPLLVALERNEHRMRNEPRETIEQIYNTIQPPSYREGFDKIYLVDETNNITLMPRQ